MDISLHVKFTLFLSFSVKLESSRQIFEKYSNIKFHKNPSSECGRTDTHSSMMKINIAFRSFANVSKTVNARNMPEFTHVGKTLANKNCVYGAISRKLNLENTSAQNILSSLCYLKI